MSHTCRLLALFLVVAVLSRSLAAEPAPAPAPTPEAAKTATDSKVVTLPKVEVKASRIRELDRTIRKLDKLIAREKKKLKANELDRTLNNQQLAKAAAIFGGNSSAHLELVAAQRVGLLETERGLLSDLKQPRSLEEVALIEKELDRIRQMRRELDNVER